MSKAEKTVNCRPSVGHDYRPVWSLSVGCYIHQLNPSANVDPHMARPKAKQNQHQFIHYVCCGVVVGWWGSGGGLKSNTKSG